MASAPKFIKATPDPERHGFMWVMYQMPSGDKWEYLLSATQYAYWNSNTGFAKNQGRGLKYCKDKKNNHGERQVTSTV